MELKTASASQHTPRTFFTVRIFRITTAFFKVSLPPTIARDVCVPPHQTKSLNPTRALKKRAGREGDCAFVFTIPVHG